MARAATLADSHGWSPLVGAQFEYSLAERTAERELLPMADALGLGAVLHSPLGGGLLTGKYRAGEEGRLHTLKNVIRTEDTAQRTAVVDELLAVAAEAGLPPSQVAVAFVRARAARLGTAAVPIIGPRTLDQLHGTVA